MAANLQNRSLVSLVKRFSGQIGSRDSIGAPFSVRTVHNSVYDKNPEENAHSTVVPDHVIPPQTEEYWAPHPKTGVFGPTSDKNPAGSGGDSGLHASATEDSALEQKAFFRPLEDLDKPPVQP